MDTLISLSNTCDDNFVVEFNIVPSIYENTYWNENQRVIFEGERELDGLISENKNRIQALNFDIEKLTNTADGLDYMIAVASGVLTGIIDIFYVGEIDFATEKVKIDEQVNKFIMNYAKKKGFEGDRLKDAIAHLEKKFPVAQDNIWSGKGFSSAITHHLDDLAHHPTIFGLVSAIIVRFFRVGIFNDKNGEWHFEFVETDISDFKKIWAPIVISGVVHWCVNIVEAGLEDKLDVEIPEPIHKFLKALASAPALIEVLKVTDNWVGHLVSDMGGSKNTAGGGMGIPGLFISLLKEISSIPGIKDTELPEIINKLYVKHKIDMRTELAVVNILGKQAIPVAINEILVRSFYFIRHLIEEYNLHKNLKDINWERTIPIGNRTIERMITISSGTFMAVDMADAAIRSATKPSSVNPAAFAGNMLLCVNFVGVGRFGVAVATDVGMELKRNKKLDERIKLYEELIILSNANVSYKQADMWISVESTGKSIAEAYATIQKSMIFFSESIEEIRNNLGNISEYVESVESKNPGLIDEISDILMWG